MGTLLGHPALRLLARRKLHGTLRRQWRRVRTPKGLVLTLLGVTLFVLWFGSLLVPAIRGRARPLDPERLRPMVALGVLLLLVLSLSGAFVYRGLFVPRQEIERLFSAPVSRSDLVRYRLWVNFGRSLFGAVLLGLVFLRHMPHPLYSFAGIFLTVQTIPLLNQLTAILGGTLETAAARRLKVLRLLGVVLSLLVVAPLAFLLATDRELEDLGLFGGFARFLVPSREGGFESPVLALLVRPFLPWARMITAASAQEFLPWFGVGVATWLACFELTARLPVDYRETSLDTAANVAARLRRAKRGGGAASGEVSRRAAAWRVPWILGRGPAGAIAWRKLGSIVRKAKGTLGVSVVVIAFVTILATVTEIGSDDDTAIAAPVFIAVLGTLYLCAGLRFDFRDELDRMEVIKAWPIRPSRLFAAMLLPEVLVVSGLLAAAILGRAVLVGQFQPLVLALVALLPTIVFAWVALDNAVFLFAPVRIVPGQEGALQNVGRGVVMMLLRMALLFLVAALGGLPAFGVHLLAREVLDFPPTSALLLAAGAFEVVLLAIDLGLVLVGGLVLQRFDVARDRG